MIVDSDSRRERYVSECPVSVVVVEIAGIVSEICFENIEPAIAVVVAHRNAHSGLLVSILAVCASCHHRDISETSVMIVAE